MNRFTKIAVSLFAVALLAMPALAQTVLTSTVGTSTLSYQGTESITVSGVPASLSFATACTGGVCTQALNVVTTWQATSTRTRAVMNLFFADPTTAMSDAIGVKIPSGQINANKDGGAFSSCNRAPDSALTGVIPANSACNVGQSINLTSANYAGNATDTFVLQIPTSEAQLLPADTFTGTLSYVAGLQ